MDSQRVILLSNRSILMHIVEQLLSDARGIELGVIGLDDPNWEERLLATAPNTVLVDSGSGNEAWACVHSLLHQLPGSNLISLDLDEPVINVFSMTRIPKSDLDGLLNAIRGPI